MPDPIGEVIAASTRQFTAEVPRGAEPPAFGAWVAVTRAACGTTLFALVSHVEVGPYAAGRQAVALGMTAEERQKEYPHVAELLRTTFRAQVLASQPRDGGPVRQTLPPHPPDIHDFVRPATPDEVAALGAPFDYLRTLVTHPDPAVPVDDLLVAALTRLRAAHGVPLGGDGVRPNGRAAPAVLVDAGRALSRLLDDDHERLRSILRRVAS
jgi:hypothetical protein